MRFVYFVIFAIISINVCAQADRKFIRSGNGNYRDGNYKQAEVDYRKALEHDPSSYKADYNLGNSLYKQQQFEAAAGKYSALIKQNQIEGSRNPEQDQKPTVENDQAGQSRSTARPSDQKSLSKYYYNLGNALFNTQKYKESIEAYKQSLRNNPEDLDAKHNLQMALRMIKEQEQKQNQKGDNNKDQKQDKQEQQESKKDQADQQKDDQQKDDQPKDQQQQQQPEPRKGEISPEDAERILQALENEEKEVMKEVQDRKEKTKKVPVEKNW